jgi:type IV pilus assembly protein PilW
MKQAPSFQTGLSLIELMVALTLGLMITVTLGYLLMGSRSTYRTQDASARVQDTGRFALEYIGRQLRYAGRTADMDLLVRGKTADLGGADITGDADDITVRYQDDTNTVITNQICLDADEHELQQGCVNGAGGQPFAEGVDAVQFRYMASDGTWGNTSNAQTQAIEVCIMVHSLANGVMNTAQRMRNCAGVTVTQPDTRLYRTFTSVFALRNRISAVP